MMDVLLLDLFGVVARPQSAAGQEHLVRLAGVPAAGFWTAYWALRPPYDRGEVSGQRYWRQVADSLKTTLDPDAMIEADVASWAALDDDTLELVDDLRDDPRQARLALLSNIPEDLAVHYENRLTQFDLLGFSCRIGHVKPEPEAFTWCLRALAVQPERVIFVDDRAENVTAAEALGMTGHLFTGAAALREVTSGLRGN